MRNRKRHFVLIGMMFLLGWLSAALAFGREYSTEPTEPSETGPAVEATEPSRPAPAKVSPQAKRSVVIYSTEDIAESPSETGPTTTGTRDHTVHRTRMIPDMPHRPEVPNVPDAPEGDGYYCGGYPIVGGAMHIRPGPYLAGWRSCSDGDEGQFWPGLLDTDISYSWSGNSGGGELTYWPYGYRYSWGDDPAYSDALGSDQARSAMESDPNTTDGDYTSYNSTEDIRLPDYGSAQPSDANEMLPDVSEAAAIPKHKAAKDG